MALSGYRRSGADDNTAHNPTPARWGETQCRQATPLVQNDPALMGQVESHKFSACRRRNCSERVCPEICQSVFMAGLSCG
jgi:hypothetical protein